MKMLLKHLKKELTLIQNIKDVNKEWLMHKKLFMVMDKVKRIERKE
jgi:hypothetical protein